jgi:hypothetical protein
MILRDNCFVRQLQMFTTAQIAGMRDRSASRRCAEREEFRRKHERHRAWGLRRRHAGKLRHVRDDSRDGRALKPAEICRQEQAQGAQGALPATPKPSPGSEQTANRCARARPGRGPRAPSRHIPLGGSPAQPGERPPRAEYHRPGTGGLGESRMRGSATDVATAPPRQHRPRPGRCPRPAPPVRAQPHSAGLGQSFLERAGTSARDTLGKCGVGRGTVPINSITPGCLADANCGCANRRRAKCRNTSVPLARIFRQDRPAALCAGEVEHPGPVETSDDPGRTHSPLQPCPLRPSRVVITPAAAAAGIRRERPGDTDPRPVPRRRRGAACDVMPGRATARAPLPSPRHVLRLVTARISGRSSAWSLLAEAPGRPSLAGTGWSYRSAGAPEALGSR